MILEEYESLSAMPVGDERQFCDALGAAWHTQAYPLASHRILVELTISAEVRHIVKAVWLCPDCAARSGARVHSTEQATISLQQDP